MKGWHKGETDKKQFFYLRSDMQAWEATEDVMKRTSEHSLISQGAEGKVYFSQFLGRNSVTKERLKK